MPINPKIKQIYDTLKEGGADVGSEQEFNDYFLAKGKDGYNNRKEVFNTLKEGGADTGKSYEEFAGWLGLHAVKPKSSTPQHTVQATKPTSARPVRTQPTRQQKSKDRPMTAAENASMISNVGDIVRRTQAGLQRTRNMMTYAKKKAGLHVEPVKLGQKSNVVETAKQYNPKTGKMQPHYLTEAGNEYDDKVLADMEQTTIDEQKRRELDPVQSQLEDAYSDRDRLEEAVSARRKELEDEYNSRPWYQRVLTEMGKAAHSDMDPAATATDPEHMGFEQDEQYMQLMAAIRKNHQTIQTLEDKKNGKMNSFWHSLGTALTNGYTFADGLPEMRDATAILNVQKHINSINHKRQTGQALTKEEAAAEAVLRNTHTDNVVQGTYGSEYGAWGRAGSGMAQSIDFMKDFMLLPGAGSIAKGVAGKVAGIGGKYLAKKAGETAVKATVKAIARATLKATGVVAGAHAAGAVISNTTGIGRTAAKMGQLSAGDVSMDKNGNYKIENQQDLMSAFAEAEREQARENGSEMFGEFIPGGKVLSAASKKALSKIGLGKISDMLTSIGNKAWYKNYTNLLSKGGYNGIPGEALEEYEGMFFDAITGHADEAVHDFTDPKQQVDIWLGCATMGALMGAVPMGLHIQGYYRYKHGMDKADRAADFRLTPDRWQPLKEQIDQTDNGNMSGFVVDNILNNKKLEPQEKEAAMNYVRNLTKFRGFNIAQVNNADETASETQGESRQQDNDRQQAYEMGREAADTADTEGDRSDADAVVLRLREAYDEIERVFADDAEMRLAQLEDDPWEVMNDQSLTPDQQDAVAYFVNSKAAMEGLNDAANEKSDNKHDEAARQIEQRTNKQSGMIHPATLKVNDRQVYIVSGNVAMFPDGSAVDIHHSSESVVVCDAETGEMKFISPEQIYKVDEPMDPGIELQAADEAIRAEQQVVLGNDTEEAPEQTEEVANDGVASDVQNENEVDLPQNETDVHEPSALNRIPKGENGEPLLEQTDPETAWDGVVEYMEDANDAQEYVESMVEQLNRNVENAKKAVSKVKPSADMAKFKADKAAARQVQADAEARLDKWMQISNVNKTRKQAERNRINAERAEADRIAHEKAVAELAEQKRIEAEKKAEQETVGTHAVNPKIKEKWDAAPKVVGSADVITLPDGSQLRGHYVLTEAGAATASHDVNNAYKPTEGFPIDENGQSVNDRDYERDEDARKISRSIADNYDSRALQSVTVVDNNGITLSGNGRNIAGELAAKNGTDGAYIDYLREFPQKYGLTAEQVQSMQHPRVHFVPDEVLPYDAATFARFNAQEMKSQSKPEAAVKLGKVVPDNTFGNIVRSLAQYDRLSDFYANEKDANSAIMELVKAGVVNDKQLPELRTGEALSAAGRELLENTLIGKVFQSNPDAVRQIIAQPGIKQSIVMALSEIAHNRTLAGGYDLSEELSKAVDLVARAKHADPDTYKEGMPVSPFGRQQGLFDDELGDSRITDATTLLLADILNSTKPGDLRKVLATYNAEAESAANGQLDIFSGELRSKEEILKDINQHFINATPKEQQALVDAAIEERKRRAAEAATSEQSGGNGTTEQTAPVETGSGQPQPVEGTPIGATSAPNEVLAQREQTETNPTEAQKEAGNYRKGHIKVDGFDIALENPKGSTRSGKDANGKEWSITMKHDYGYIRGTKGTDGDHIDVYLSDNPTAGNVYVVDQINQQTGAFDEHKVMYGFGSMEEAVQAYRDQYEDGWKVGKVTEVSREEFKKWVDSSTRKTKPFADYKGVKSLDTERTQSGENYAHNSEEIMHGDVKPAESSESYTITPTQYTNKKGKTSDMYLVKFNHELSKDEKTAAKAFISEPLAEGRGTPRGWYDREQGGYIVRSEEVAKQLGNMLTDETVIADAQPLTVQDYRNAASPATRNEQEKKPDNTVTVEDAAIQDVEAKVYNPEQKKGDLEFNGDVSKEDFNDALKDLRSLLGVSDDEGDAGILFRDDDELTKEQRKKIKAAGLSVTQVLVDNGMVKFPDYASKMVSLIGDKIRPWLKSFYEGVRWEPGYERVDFTPSEEVARFDVQNFDKPSPNILKQAEMVVAEQKAAKISKQTEQEVKSERNEKRKEYEKQTEANTAAIAEEAGTVASEARVVAKRATTGTEVRVEAEKVDATLEKVNNQLALLGYYEADAVDKDFNEAYGYMRNAEKKAVKDATELAKRLADDFGIDLYETTHTALGKNGKRKSKPLATANIAPIGGDISIHLPIQDGKDLCIYINLKTTDAKGSFVQGDNLEVGNIMYRIENPNTTGDERYGSNNFATPDITYDRLRDDISRIIDSTVRETPTKQPTNNKVLAQYNALKSKHPDAKLLFHVGDFYETYQDDAKDVSNTLGIVLTKRNDGVNMAGFPYHELDTYLPKLIRAGYRVAICDQLEMPKETEKVVPKDTPQPKKVNVESLVRELQEKGKARLRDHAEEVKEKPATPDLHGFNIGDKVMYKGKEATLYDTDNGRPVLDAGLAPVMYEVTDWDKLTPVSSTTDTTPAKEKTSTEKEKPIKKNNSKKKSVSLKREPTVGDLFGDLFSNNNLDGKDNDTARTQQAERSSRENGSVGSISADRDGVLDTRSTGGTDGRETARVSDTTGTVADGERKEVSGQRSGRTTSGGNHRDGEAERPLPERGQRIGDRDDADGRSAVAGVADESQRTNRPAADTSDQLVHSKARRGRNVASAKLSEPKFKRNYLYPDNSSEIDNMTPQQRLRSNVEALEVVRTLMKEGREATAEESEILGRYRGWGGVDLGRAYSTNMMRRSTTGRWGTQTENDKLLSHLADIIDDLYPNGERGVLSAINRAALTSYYTPTAVAKVMNGFVEQAGFKGGNMLDPSMGSGVFEGTMSKDIQQRTMIHGIELDWLTGQIARNLYPDANVLVTGYEQAGTADNAYDVVMSNIPFGDLSVTDKTWKHDSSPVRKAAQNRIHNYFAVKMIDNTRPGGLCVIMTSNAILDTKSNQIIREHFADQAEVLGVVRLPDNTFKGAGTSVVTDVVFLRKFKDEADRTATRGNEAYTANIEKPFLSSGELQLKNPADGKTYKVAVNGYFAKNKDMMIGDGKAGGQYRADEFGLSSTMGTDDIAKVMGKLVEKKIIGDRKGKLFDTHKTEREVKQAVSEAYKGDGDYISSGNIVEQDGMIGVVTSTKNKYGDVTTTFTEMPSLKSKADRIQGMFPVRKAMKQLIDMQIQGEKEHNLSEVRAELQKAYDDFVKKYGRLNDKGNDFLTEDIDGYTLRSLEKYDDGKFVGLSDIFTKNTIKPALDLKTAKTPQDAISLSLAEYGEINPSFMEEVLGDSWAEQCGETLFKTPFTEDEYETADAYLSGDVKTKLEQARAAVKEDASLQRNVKALEAIQPKDIPFEDISIRMGARWIPAEVYTDFMFEQFGIQKYEYRGNKSGVEYMPEVDQYVVNVAKNELGGEADAWRTSRRSASEVFTAALQDKSLSVFDTIKEDGKETKVLNKEETELLNNKIQDLRTAFEDWIGQQPEREEKLMRLYNDKFNRTVLRKFDGSHLNVAGLMGKELRPHQKDAVWMLINNRGGIVDHIVGAGKTLVMQSAIMEMRRMGIAKKPMIIALKSTVAQIAKEFREVYPAARILAPTEKDFASNNRKKFMAQIALNDYDCVILSHDQYCMLPHTEEVERSVIDEQMAQLDNAIEFLYGQEDKSQLTKKQIKGLEKRKNNLETKLTNLLDRKIDREFTFEGLGVDYLFVDECQHFKSLPYVSTYDRVAGLGDKKGSQKAIALLNGVRYLQKMHQGDQGTVFLSGTTISNSLSEIYHLLNYLRPSEMERLGMTTFDAWAGNFAIHTAELEYGVTSELKEKDRFRSLTNIPELAKMYAEIADVRNDLNLKLPKPKMRSHIVTVPQTDLMQEINREIVNMVKSKNGSYFNIASNDNTPWGLLASTLSAKAAINPRLIDESWEAEGGKIPTVCENVKKIYDQFAEQKGTQLIFCDTGVPGKGKKYDAYTDIINRLVNDYGIPRKEIADIHVANTDEKRKELFAKVNDGSVRILIGGTKNMGTGVNVQKRIVAMHHVDVPWTPADREQREGRGVRQGNEIARDFNDDNVDVYFYATEGSLDMYKYQLQETKGKLFAQFKSGTIGDRTFDEGDAEGDFDPAEVVAMLSGNPVIFEKSKQDKKVEKLRRAKRAYESDWQRRHARYDELQTKKSNFERLLSLNASDVRELERGGFTPDVEGKYPTTVTVSVKDDYSSRKTFDKPKEAGAYIHELLKQGKKVQLSGFHQTANISLPVTDAGLFGKPVAELESYGGIKYTVEVSDDDTAAGVSFRNLLQKVYNNRKVYERNIEDVNNQLKGADPGENAFPKQAELDEALKEKKRLDEEYKKLSDEEEKPSDSDDTRYRDFDEEVNEQFNRELAELTEENADTKIFNLGSPSSILLSAGVEDKPMKLYGNKVIKKMKKHGFALEELQDLPKAVANPIAVLNNYQREGNRTILTELRSQGKNIMVAITLGKNGVDVDFNIVSSVFGKRESNVVDWINKGYLTYIHKEKALNYLYFSERGFSEAAENSELSSAANIVNNFVNPNIGGEKFSLQGNIDSQDTTPQAKTLQAKVLSDKLNTPIRVVSDPAEISELPSRRQQRAKGWWSAKNDEVVILLPNNVDAADVANTAVHEVVGHKGLRKLIGEERFDEFLDEVYDHASKPICASIDQAERKLFDAEVDRLTQQKNAETDRAESRKGVFSRAEATVEANRKRERFRREATEEYMADMAGRIGYEGFEKMSAEELTFWGKVKAKVQQFLDKFLRGLKIAKGVRLTDKDVAYILYKSWKNLRNGGKPTIMDAAEDALMRSKTHYDELSEDEVMFRDGDSVEYRKVQARNLYEQRVSRGLYQMQEAIQDSMLGLKEAMEAILKAEGGYTGKIEDVAGYENPYLGENRLSSVNKAECSAFAQTLFKPMLEEVAKLAKTAKERAELTDYMMAKHGLERNNVMARQAAEKVAHDEFWKELRTAERAAADDPLDQDAADVLADVKQRMQDRENELYAENRSRDYAGLTALTGKDDVADAESEAGQMVSDYEANHDTTALWDKVNAVTKATLQKTYECGIISKATYDDISDMYEHYIPLRGFDEKTSDEAYAYLSDKHSAFNAPIKTAKGRKSKADDPFANMEAMVESAIMQGNRNMLVKRKFMRFVQNHPSDLVSISDLWLRYDDVADEWKPVNAGDVKGTERIEEDDTPREVERKMRDFEEKMQQLSESAPDHFKRQKDHPEIPYRVIGDRDLRQHQVLVKQGGKDYVLTINGNPRAAQALNGQTNPDNDMSGALGAILHAAESVNRQLSAFYTTRNPDFIVSNFMRDMLYANTMVWVKESPNYALRFHKNFAKVNPAKMKVLLTKLRKGTLDMNDETEKAFSLFMANGGETGYSNIRDIEQRKNDIRRELSKHNGKLPIRKAWSLLGERLDEYNRAVENCARFAAFMTSRQMKRSIDRSVYDAKEISVNFNKKGSGAKFMGATGQTKSGNAAAFVSGFGRSSYVFWNAAIQGTTNFGRQFKHHPGKALAGAATMFLLGALVAGIAGDDGNDDSKNSYYNLPEYVRRSNVIFRLPGMEETWISIPLPVEYRALYGMGELMTSTISGKEHYTSGELASQIASQVSQALPIDFMEGGGGFKAFVPSAVKPYAEVMTNKSWTGMPLYKDTPWNKDMPEWTKAYKSANKQLVGFSKLLNEISGGDAYTSGVIDINPAQVEYLLNGYFGGVSSTIDKFAKMGETALGQREYDPRSFLILNRLVKSGDERTEYRHINNEYFRLKQEHDKLKARLKHYEEDTYNGVFDYAEKINWLNKSPEYQRLEIFEDYSSDINAINKELKEPMNDNERKELEKELYGLKKKLVDEANKTRK